MPRRNARRKEPVVPDELRAYDGRGNVRPADDRFLTGEQKAAKAAYVQEVKSRPEATPVTSPRDRQETPNG